MKIEVYLNFDGQAEEAFMFYKSAFGGEFQTFQKMKDAPGGDELSEEEQNRIMHVALPLKGGAILMGSDIMPSMGPVLSKGNNINICIQPDSKDETDRLFEKLSAGGHVESAMKEEFWGDYFGSFIDKFGISWLISFALAANQTINKNNEFDKMESFENYY